MLAEKIRVKLDLNIDHIFPYYSKIKTPLRNLIQKYDKQEKAQEKYQQLCQKTNSKMYYIYDRMVAQHLSNVLAKLSYC